MDVSLRQIRYLATLVAERQYARAARVLGISQPSLSLQIKALEDALGGMLVERRRTGLILTPLGREVAAHAQTVLQAVDALTQAAVTSEGDLGGTLRLGTSPTVGPYLLPKVLHRLHLDHPSVKLIIRDAPPRVLAEELSAGRHDMILTQLPLPAEEYRVLPLFREPLGLAVSQEHRLARQETARKADLAGQSILTLSSSYALHHQMAALAVDAGANMREDFEGTSLDALRQMVALGMGVTLLPALYVRSEVGQQDPDVAILPMKPQHYRQIGLASRITSGNPAAFEAFAEITRRVVKESFSKDVTLIG
ncbi:MAG: hydrogen peroxide-inducible genes activator [Pseudomonadota bacterium]